MTRPYRIGDRLLLALQVVALISVAGALGADRVRGLQERSRRVRCGSGLKQIGLRC